MNELRQHGRHFRFHVETQRMRNVEDLDSLNLYENGPRISHNGQRETRRELGEHRGENCI